MFQIEVKSGEAGKKDQIVIREIYQTYRLAVSGDEIDILNLRKNIRANIR